MDAKDLSKLQDLYDTEWAYINGPWKPGAVSGASGVKSHVPGVFFAPGVFVDDMEFLLDIAWSEKDQEDAQPTGEAVTVYDYRPEVGAACITTISSMSWTGWVFKSGEVVEGGHEDDALTLAEYAGQPYICWEDASGDPINVHFTMGQKLPWLH